MDPLSGVLSLLKPRNTMCGGFDVGGDWSTPVPEHDGIKCYAVVSGQCWLSVEGVAEPVHLKPGDCFLLPRAAVPPRQRPGLAAGRLQVVYSRPLNGGIATCNGGGEFFVVGGRFGLAGNTRASCWGCCRRSCTSGGTRTRRRCAGRSSG